MSARSNRPDSWVGWTPADHWQEAQRLVEEVRSRTGDPLAMDLTVAQMHVEMATAKSMERLVTLFGGRVQYVDTRRQG